MVISSGFTFPWRERPAILPSMMMALGDCTMSLKVTVAASIRTFISAFTFKDLPISPLYLPYISPSSRCSPPP